MLQGPTNQFLTFDQEDGEQAARNMRHLSKATLVDCELTYHIIANIPAYSQLTQVALRLGAEPQRWVNISTTTVEKLQWEVLYHFSDDKGTAASILHIVGAVFLEVRELDISNSPKENFDAPSSPVPRTAANTEQSVILQQLRSFSYSRRVSSDQERKLILLFLKNNNRTLVSLNITVGFADFSQGTMAYIQRVVAAVPNLKSLAIPTPKWKTWTSHKLPIWSDFTSQSGSELLGVEFFEMRDIECSLSREIGHFFSGWSSLRVLKMRVPLYEAHAHDGRPHFDTVAPVRKLLCQNLQKDPRSLSLCRILKVSCIAYLN
jgi:hypothetical protein